MTAIFRALAFATLMTVFMTGQIAPARAMTAEDFVTVSLIPGWRVSDDQHMAGLRIQLAPGWHTYWRQPGDAGIPPQLDWTGSQNFKGAEIVWPTPELFEQNGLKTLVYEDEVILPLVITPVGAGEIDLSGNLFLGVCEEVCIPVEVNLRATLPAKGSVHAGIKASLSDQPADATRMGRDRATCSARPIEDGLSIAVTLDTGGTGAPDHVVLETAKPGFWVSEPTLGQSGHIVTATSDFVPPNGKPFVLERGDIIATIFQGDQVVQFIGCKAGS